MLNINGLEFYPPDIHKIPYYNYVKFQKYLLMEAGIGNDLQAVLQRAQTIQLQITEERDEDAQTEVGNLILALFSAWEGLSYKSMAVACMVVGADISTDESVRDVSKRISESVTEGDLTGYIAELKKKLMPD
jgi:hypothetical protein